MGVYKDKIKIATLERGNFIGEFHEIVNGNYSPYSFTSEGETKLFFYREKKCYQIY